MPEKEKMGKLRLLLGAAILAVPTSAFAQSADAPQTAGADAGTDDIVVTGFRSALAASQRAKRDAPVVLEAITPEDLGRFSDNSIADQLQRVPGVQIDRGTDGRSGDHVTIRGLGAQFVTATMNGRTPGGYGSEGLVNLRQFAVDVLPSEILSGVLIYKTPSASMVESGLGGTVDFQTLKPLDYNPKDGRSYFGNISFRGSDTNYTKAMGWGVSGVYGAKLFNDTLGIVVSGMANNNPQHTYYVENRPTTQTLNVANASGTISQQNVLVPGKFDFGLRRFEAKRVAFNGTVQWKPADNLVLTADYTYSKYNRPDDRLYDEIGGYSDSALTSGVFQPGGVTIANGAATNFDFSKYTPPAGTTAAAIGVDRVPLGYNNNANIQVGGLNAKWNSGRWTVSTDLSFNKLHSDQNLFILPSNFVNYPSYNSLNYAANTSGPPTFNIGAPDLSSPSLYSISTTIQRLALTRNNGLSGNLDVAYEANDVLTLKAGARWAQQRVDVRSATNVASLTAEQSRIVTGLTFPGGTLNIFPGYNFGLNTVPYSTTVNVAGQNNGFVPVLSLDSALLSGPFSQAATAGTNGWSLDSGTSHRNVERTLAGYVQADVKGTLFAMAFTGNIGVRVVRTSEQAQAYGSIRYVDARQGLPTRPDSTYVPFNYSNDYTNALPSFNINFQAARNVNLRLAVAKTLSRPEYESMSPINSIIVPDPNSAGYNANSLGTASIGNANLKPETAWNYDATLEFYTGTSGSIIGSVFYKDVSNVIGTSTVTGVTIPGQGSQKFDVTTAENLSNGYVFGFEAGFNQSLAILARPLSGFGIQANYVYVDSKISQPINGERYGFPGASKHSVNATFYYSKGALDARVSLAHRTSYLSQLPYIIAYPTSTTGSTNVDASVTYTFNDHLDVTLTASNLTGQNRRDYVGNVANLVNFYTVPRQVSATVRLKL